MDVKSIKHVHLGSGLIGIGRKWGHVQSTIPNEQEVFNFLSFAVKLGISYFDTAPAYGTSEERLAKFLTSHVQEREKLIVATKFGEQWNTETNEGFVDHSYEALKKSFDRSLALLKQIDLLYLHKAHMQALQNPDVLKAFAYAKERGIKQFGASVSDLESAAYVLNSPLYSVIQFPYNKENQTFSKIIDQATKKGKIVVINRPFNMGKNADDKSEAFRFILQKKFNGFILTGTKSIKHLQENYTAFREAINNL
ncbi:MAG TPA: aldo/keto reductase [Methylomirabilota bacterium]|nr:aldo/keto reductase [Methylomirabilota bacterium]